MGFLKKLFGGNDQPTDNKKKENDNKQFDTLKYDGVRALRQGQSADEDASIGSARSPSPDHYN